MCSDKLFRYTVKGTGNDYLPDLWMYARTEHSLTLMLILLLLVTQ